ncbi:hypothetical protein FACS1894164_18890 [Spirochaetia bacterium]|nr:hypothetical protein FACS1894164_18890 [Spirochaetia bacterium]
MKKAVLTGLLIGTIAVSSVFSAAGRDNSGAAGRLIIYSPNISKYLIVLHEITAKF